MLNFKHAIPTELYFGKGQIEKLPEAVGRYGKKVLLVYGGGSVKKSGLYDTVLGLLEGFEITELPGVAPNPRLGSVEQGVKLCREKGIEVILAVGGGSTIDCSKAIAVGVYYEGDDLWEMVKGAGSVTKGLPLVDVLTLSATGTEFDPFAVITNPATNEKLGGVYIYPSVSICDPTYTFSVSAYQTAAGSADIMSHIMEGYFAHTADSDLADGIAETVLKSVIHNLPIALREPTNYSARANLMADSSIACCRVAEYGKDDTCWPAHAMEHELSAYYDITHGVGLAILTPRWMRFILKKDPSVTWRFAKFARNVWGFDGDDEAALAQQGIDALEQFFKDSGIPMTLTELGIGEEHFAVMASHANPGNMLRNAFVPLTDEDIVEIFKACL